MALILPEIKHEYLFHLDTEETKNSVFDQCRAEGKQAATVEIATLSDEEDVQIQYQDIDPTKVDITLPDTVYTFADLMSTVPTTLFNNADLDKSNIERIYNEVKHELNIQ